MADWFELDGRKSTDFGVYVETYPSIVLPSEKAKTHQIPGRHGDLKEREGAYAPIILTIDCFARQLDHLNEFSAWLRDFKWFRMGKYPHFAYKASMISQIDIMQVMKGRENRRFPIVFDCQPFRYVWPEADPIEIVTSEHPIGSASVINPGNVESAPRLILEGNGEFSLMIGLTQLTFRDVDDGIIVDCDAEECFNLEQSLLANDKVEIGDDTFPKLLAGGNMISWSGDISKITIIPRWRNV